MKQSLSCSDSLIPRLDETLMVRCHDDDDDDDDDAGGGGGDDDDDDDDSCCAKRSAQYASNNNLTDWESSAIPIAIAIFEWTVVIHLLARNHNSGQGVH